MPCEVVYEITQEDLFEILTGDRRLILPAGAVIQNTWHDVRYEDTVQTGCSFHIRVSHESYADIARGRRIPTIHAQLEPARNPVAATITRAREAKVG